MGARRAIAAGWTCVATAVAAPAASTPARQPASADTWEYRVERGDTLIGIAHALLVEPRRWATVQRLNRVADPRRLRPGTVLRFPAAWVRRTGTPATLVFVHGDVRVTRATAGAEAQAVSAGSEIGPGDIVETAAEATATLKFADGSRLLVPAGTRLRLDALEALGRDRRPHTAVDLLQGEADAQVVPAAGPGPRVFTVGTPAVNLGVRGTEFRARVSTESGQVQAEVTEGVVQADLAPPAAREGSRRKPPSRRDATGQGAPLAAGFGISVAEGTAALAPVRLLPPPDLEAVPARLERVPLRFEWPPVPGAATYRAEVLGTEDDLLLDSQPPDAATKWADLPDGAYRLRVRAVDAQGLEGRNADRPFVLKARPEPPLLLEPRAGARSYGAATTFQWTLAQAPRHYRLQVSASQDFTTPDVDRAGLAGPGQSVPLGPGTWWWRMAAVGDPDDAGPFGEAQSFEQRAVPEPPAVDVPRRDARGLVFAWGALPAGRQVHYQVATDPEFAHVVVDEATTDPQGVLPKPSAGKYYIHARTVDEDGFEGPYGAPQVVEVRSSLWWLLIPLGMVLWSL